MKVIEELGMLYPETGNLTRKYRYALYECGTCGKHHKNKVSRVKINNFKECNSCMRTKHGFSRERLYTTWTNMKGRCYTPSDKSYVNYGGRGIMVCAEWLEFSLFRTWALSNGYTDTLTIERKKTEDDYTPDNCIWIPMAKQAQNKRNSNFLTEDEASELCEVYALTDITQKELGKRAGYGEGTMHCIIRGKYHIENGIVYITGKGKSPS